MYHSQRRQGRPRQDRPAKDQGTKELQQKRKILIEGGRVENFSFAESLLGILYIHQVISKPLYEAGYAFGELGYRYEACLGHSFRSRASAFFLNQEVTKGREFSEWYDEKQTKAWRKALKSLKRAGPCPYKMVLKVVFYDQDLYATPLPRFLLKEVHSLRQGLACLAAYFKGELKDTQDKLDDPGLNLGKSTTSQQLLKECQSFHLP